MTISPQKLTLKTINLEGKFKSYLSNLVKECQGAQLITWQVDVL